MAHEARVRVSCLTEDFIIDHVTLGQVLAPLSLADREMLLLIYHIGAPLSYRGAWPPNLTEIGVYIGTTHEGKPLSEAAVRYRRDMLLAKWLANPPQR